MRTTPNHLLVWTVRELEAGTVRNSYRTKNSVGVTTGGGGRESAGAAEAM